MPRHVGLLLIRREKAMQLGVSGSTSFLAPHLPPPPHLAASSVRHMSMHIYELALRTLLMGFDAAAPPAPPADADARFVFPRFVSVLTVQYRKMGRGGGAEQ